MGIKNTKMGKKKIITPVPVPSTPVPATKPPNSSDLGTKDGPAYGRQRQPSALSIDGEIMWQELERELQQNNLK